MNLVLFSRKVNFVINFFFDKMQNSCTIRENRFLSFKRITIIKIRILEKIPIRVKGYSLDSLK
jgi:hypothetical protein